MNYSNLTYRLMVAAIVAATIGFVSCDNDPQNPIPEISKTEGSELMQFNGSAREDTKTFSQLQTLYGSFGVYTFKTMADLSTQNVMLAETDTPYEVIWDEDNSMWDYAILSDTRQQYLKYWDFSARCYDFSAIAPFRTTIGSTTYSMLDAPYNAHVDLADGTIHISNIQGNIGRTFGIDWLAARHSRDYNPLMVPALTDTDLMAAADDPAMTQPAELSSPVQLRFHHLMSLIEVRIYNKEGSMVSMTDASFTIVRNEGTEEEPDFQPTTIIDCADFDQTLWGDDDYWNEFSPVAGATTSTLYQATGATLMISGNSADPTILISNLEIPQDVTDLYVRAYLKGATTEVSGIFPLKFASDPTWLPGVKYIYKLNISDNQEIILFDVNVESFKWDDGGPIEGNDDLVNW